MYRYILILLLITVELFALKVKAKQYGDIVKVKALIKSPMIGKVQATKRGMSPDYIKRIVAHVGGELVYDVALSPSWQRNPIVKFKYKYFGRSNNIKFTIIDNKGKKNTQSFKIKKSLFKDQDKHQKNSGSLINEKVEATDVWDTKVLQDAVSKLYRTSKFVKEKINISTSYTGDYHPDTHIVGISSDIQLKSIAVFAKIGEMPALVAMFRTPKNTIIDYRFNLKMYSYSGPGTEIIVVGEGQNGTFYKSTSYLGLSYDETRFIKGCEQRNNNLDTNSCKEIATEISLQKLKDYYQSLMKTSYLPASRKLLLQQNLWLENRKNVCPNSSSDCLSKYYQQRMQLLQKIYTKKHLGFTGQGVLCESFPGKQFSNNLLVFGGKAEYGKKVDYQIADSNRETHIIDVIVNSPDKPVGLILQGNYPSIWNIKWTKGTSIEAVIAFGNDKQFIAGLPKEIPILAGNDNKSCDLSFRYQGTFFTENHQHTYSGSLKHLAKKAFNKNFTSVFMAEQGNLLVGNNIDNKMKLYSSDDVLPESFRDKSKPLIGQTGLNRLLEEGKIRPLKEEDLTRWFEKMVRIKKSEKNRFNAVTDSTLEKWEREKRIQDILDKSHRTHRVFSTGYMILDKITIPIQAKAHYFLKEGVSYPDISMDDEPTIYEFDTMTCNGSAMSGCKNY
jgi:uncharacterized protein